MSISCIIVEDDKISTLHLQRMIEQQPTLMLVGTFYNADDALHFLSQAMIDLIFLDIEMPGINGFQLLDQLPYRPNVILTTAKADYAFTAFEYNVTDYLKKPITLPRFKEAIKKIEPFIAKQKDNHANDIFIRADGKLIRIHKSEICFVEASGDYVKLVTEKKNYLSLTTLKSIEENLNGQMFLKVHRSYIVNTEKIKDIEDNTVLIGRHVIPISKAHRKLVMDKLNII